MPSFPLGVPPSQHSFNLPLFFITATCFSYYLYAALFRQCSSSLLSLLSASLCPLTIVVPATPSPPMQDPFSLFARLYLHRAAAAASSAAATKPRHRMRASEESNQIMAVACCVGTLSRALHRQSQVPFAFRFLLLEQIKNKMPARHLEVWTSQRFALRF